MELIFDYLQHDMMVAFGVAAVCAAIAIAALWKVVADLRQK